MVKKTVKALTLRTEEDTEFVTIGFEDGSTLDLKGPRSGLKHTERKENGATVYDCEFEGFEPA